MLEANKDSKEEEKTEKTVEKMKKEGPSSSEKVDKMCKFILTHKIHLTESEQEPCFAMYITMLYMIAGLRLGI